MKDVQINQTFTGTQCLTSVTLSSCRRYAIFVVDISRRRAANSLRRVFPAHSAFIDYKAINFKEIALTTGWSRRSGPLSILINVLPFTC